MLKSKKMLIFMVVLTLLSSLFSTSLLPVEKASAATWNLVWNDEFDGTTLNTSNWVYDIGTGPNSDGWGNNELQYYTNRTQNVAVTGGNLEITALQESYGGRNYTSGRIKTLGKQAWTYGKIEARIKLPTGQGIWPAFWMLGSNFPTTDWPKCGEIDIMEHVNTEGVTHGTIHWDYNGYQYYGGSSTTLDFTQYHIYTIEWNASSIKWFIDGAQFWEANIANSINGTDEFHKPFFILLNLAIGGNWPGSPNSSTILPAKMYVDYVRVYQDGGTTTQVATPTFSPAGGTYSTAQTVSISCATSGATIRYTTDGSTPTASSAVYSSPITVSSTQTIKAYAVKSGLTDSAIAIAAYTISSGSSPTTWYLYNTAVSGATPAGQNMQTANSSVTGWQPIKTVNTTAAYWYAPAETKTYAAGTWNFTLWTNSPGASSNIKVDLYKVNANGGSAVLIGSQTKDINTTGTGNHFSTYTFTTTASTALSNQRLMVKITKTSGADATMAYNTNDFPTRLVTP